MATRSLGVRVEALYDIEKSDEKEVPCIYSNDDLEDDNDDDQSIDIEETDDDEHTESDNKDQLMDDTEKNNEDKIEEEKGTNQEPSLDEQDKDDQLGVLASKTRKENPTLFLSTSSHSVSSNYDNQFLIFSPEHSLLGTVKETADAEITSMVDVQIQQEIMPVLLAPLLDVLASVVPPCTCICCSYNTNNSKHRVFDLEKEVKELKQADLSTTHGASIRSEVLAVSNSTGKSAQAEETDFKAEDTNMSLNQGDDLGNTDEQPNVEAASKQDWFKKPARPPTLDPETQENYNHINFFAFSMNRLKISKLTKPDLVGPNNPEGNRCPCDLNKPLPLHELRGRLTVLADFFFNNDLEYLRGGSTDKKNTASTTKTKAIKYEIEGISHWGSQRQRFYGYVINRVSKHDVYSTMRIQSVTRGTVNKWYGYGHLKEIVVRRANQKLYKFKEGDFPRLHLNDIEDMLLLVVQNRLNNLKGDVIVDLAKALRMYTQRIIIQKRVEDLQLGVESYHKKLNISKPRICDIDMPRRTLYTTLSEPQGVIYKDNLKRKRLMCTKELYKFSDGTLTTVRNTLDHMLKNLRLGYNKAIERRKWNATDQK
ncbi:hypothetical protein Tco_1330009 [Tanacetum coccineum]